MVSAAAVTPIAPVVVFSVIGAVAEAASVPDVFGSVRVGVPAVACGVMVAVPDVLPAKPRVPSVAPGLPKTGVTVAAHVSAAVAERTAPLAADDKPVPPRPIASVPVQPSVRLVAASNDVAGVPPSVSVTFVSSTRVSAAPEAISEAATVATVNGAPADACLTYRPAPPVAEKSVVPAGSVMVPDAVSGALIVSTPEVEPIRISGCASLKVRPPSMSA